MHAAFPNLLWFYTVHIETDLARETVELLLGSTKHTGDKSSEPAIIFKQKWQCVTQCILFGDSALAFKHSQHLNKKRALKRQVGIFALLSSF